MSPDKLVEWEDKIKSLVTERDQLRADNARLQLHLITCSRKDVSASELALANATADTQSRALEHLTNDNDQLRAEVERLRLQVSRLQDGTAIRIQIERIQTQRDQWQEVAGKLKRLVPLHGKDCLSYRVVEVIRTGDTNDADVFGKCNCAEAKVLAAYERLKGETK